jgi:flagellar protein FliL
MTDEVEEDEDEEGEDEESEGGSGGGLKKLILFVVLPIILLGGTGAGLFFSGMLDSVLGIESGDGQEGEKAEEEATPSYYMNLDEILVTLSGKGRKQGFLKMRISLELENQQDESRIASVMPRIIDNFQVFLRELRVEELQGSQGIYRVKEELLARVNAAARPAKVKDVLIGEILVQ